MTAKHVRMYPTGSLEADESELEKIIRVDLDEHLSKKGFLFDGVWLSRRSSIRYIAYVGSGIHSGKPETQKDKQYAPTI